MTTTTTEENDQTVYDHPRPATPHDILAHGLAAASRHMANLADAVARLQSQPGIDDTRMAELANTWLEIEFGSKIAALDQRMDSYESDLDDRCEEAEKDAGEAKDAVKEIDDRVDDIESLVDDATERLNPDHIHGRIDECESEIRGTDDNVESLGTRIDDIESDRLDDLDEKTNKNDDRLDDVESQITVLEQSMEALEVADHVRDLAGLGDRIAAIERMVARVSAVFRGPEPPAVVEDQRQQPPPQPPSEVN